MTSLLQSAAGVVCRALGVDALAVRDLTLIEEWSSLPAFSVERLTALLKERQPARKVSSPRYWDAAVREAFARVPVAPGPSCRPRLLCERPWPEYLAACIHGYVQPDAATVEYLRDRWTWEREALGLLIGEADEDTDRCPPLPGGAPEAPSFPLAA